MKVTPVWKKIVSEQLAGLVVLIHLGWSTYHWVTRVQGRKILIEFVDLWSEVQVTVGGCGALWAPEKDLESHVGRREEFLVVGNPYLYGIRGQGDQVCAVVGSFFRVGLIVKFLL
jgi:hypothetical protein